MSWVRLSNYFGDDWGLALPSTGKEWAGAWGLFFAWPLVILLLCLLLPMFLFIVVLGWLGCVVTLPVLQIYYWCVFRKRGQHGKKNA